MRDEGCSGLLRPGGGDRPADAREGRPLTEAFVEPAHLGAPARAVAAARAFSAGNGYLPGQAVDRRL
jgi:hypothetical protein